VLEPINLPEQLNEPVEFDVVRHRQFLGAASGTHMRVCLDLFGNSTLEVNGQLHDVHLRIGRRA
jgi:hypothetical protein